MSMDMWSSLKKFEDGENLNAETLNVPIGQLGDRTSYLYSRLMALISSGKMSAVVLTGVNLSSKEGLEPSVGNVVYLEDNNGQTFAAAKATMSLSDDFKAAESAFTVGILQSRDNRSNKGDVVVYGSIDVGNDGIQFDVSSVIESVEEFRPGRYYLSSNEAGRLTSNPNGPIIYVCTISGSVGVSGAMTGKIIVSPQFLDIGTSHVHRTAVLTARPAGFDSTDGYAPIDSDSPLMLKFGGTWTSDEKVDYSFFVDASSFNWPGKLL